MRLTTEYSNRRRTRLQRRGLGELLEAHPLNVHKDARGGYHTGSWCDESVGPTALYFEDVSVRDLSCTCWGRGLHAQNLHEDLCQVAVILAYEDDIREAERSLERGEVNAEAVARATTWSGATEYRTKLPEIQEAYDAWIEELEDRSTRIAAQRGNGSMRSAQEAAIRRIVAGTVAKTVEEMYTTQHRSLQERQCTRTLIGAWQYEVSYGRRDASRHVQKLVGHVGEHGNVPLPQLGRWTSMWVRDAEKLLERGLQAVRNDPWELVVYGAGFNSFATGRRQDPEELTPFVLKEEDRQVLAVLPRTVRRHLAANGKAAVRCREIPGSNGEEGIAEIIGALWEPRMLLDSDGLDRLAGAAAALLA